MVRGLEATGGGGGGEGHGSRYRKAVIGRKNFAIEYVRNIIRQKMVMDYKFMTGFLLITF